MQPKMGGPNEDQNLTQSPENWDSFRVFNESSVGPPSGRSWLSDLDWGGCLWSGGLPDCIDPEVSEGLEVREWNAADGSSAVGASGAEVGAVVEEDLVDEVA